MQSLRVLARGKACAHNRRLLCQKFPLGSTVVDVGFGQGFFIEEARKHGIRAIGVDRDPVLVESALSRGLEAIHGDAHDLAKVIGEAVDGVMAAHIIEHLTPDGLGKLFDDAAAITKPGGAAILVTPNPRDMRVISDWFWNDPTHVRPYMAGAVQELLDPKQWRLDAQGLGPQILTRQLPMVMLQRLRYGRHYGRSENWYLLRRV